jgi:hypothetical protein
MRPLKKKANPAPADFKVTAQNVNHHQAARLRGSLI